MSEQRKSDDKVGSTSTRRNLLAGLSLATTSVLAGCQDLDSVGGGSNPVTSSQSKSETPQPTQTNSDNSARNGTVEIVYDQADSDEPVDIYTLRNTTSEMATLVTITLPQRNTNSNIIQNIPRLESGGSIPLRVNENDRAPAIRNQGTWLESEYNIPDDTTDVTATPSQIDRVSDDGAARVTYEIPNPTDIDPSEVRQVRLNSNREFIIRGKLSLSDTTVGVSINYGSSGISISTPRPIWTSTISAEVASTTSSGEFTFKVDTEPLIDVSIGDIELNDDILSDPTLTVTAQSRIPVLDAQMIVYMSGPSVDQSAEQFSSIRLNNTGRTLVDRGVGKEQIGQSRSITLDDYVSSVTDFPLEEDDTINILVLSGQGRVKYPISYIERSIQNYI